MRNGQSMKNRGHFCEMSFCELSRVQKDHSAANHQDNQVFFCANRVTFFPLGFPKKLGRWISVTSTHWKKMSGPWEVPCTWGCRGFMARSWCSFTASQLMNLGRNGECLAMAGNIWFVKYKVQSNLMDDMKYMKCDECISISNTLLCKTELNLASSTSIKLPAGDSKASNCLPPQKLNSLESQPSCRWKANPALTQPSNWLWVKTQITCCSSRNSWNLWMLIPLFSFDPYPLGNFTIMVSSTSKWLLHGVVVDKFHLIHLATQWELLTSLKCIVTTLSTQVQIEKCILFWSTYVNFIFICTMTQRLLHVVPHPPCPTKLLPATPHDWCGSRQRNAARARDVPWRPGVPPVHCTGPSQLIQKPTCTWENNLMTGIQRPPTVTREKTPISVFSFHLFRSNRNFDKAPARWTACHHILMISEDGQSLSSKCTCSHVHHLWWMTTSSRFQLHRLPPSCKVLSSERRATTHRQSCTYWGSWGAIPDLGLCCKRQHLILPQGNKKLWITGNFLQTQKASRLWPSKAPFLYQPHTWVWVNTYENTIFSGLFTSINPSYDLGFTKGTRFWHTATSQAHLLPRH